MPRVGDAREDWSIIRALSEVMGKPLPYDDKSALRKRMAEVAPHFAATDTVQLPMWLNGEYFKVSTPCITCQSIYFVSICFACPLSGSDSIERAWRGKLQQRARHALNGLVRCWLEFTSAACFAGALPCHACAWALGKRVLPADYCRLFGSATPAEIILRTCRRSRTGPARLQRRQSPSGAASRTSSRPM